MTDATLQTAVLFPGQGSQEPDMGKDLAEHNADFMDLWIKAEKLSGQPLREIYWGGTNEDMAQTRALQPAMTVTNVSVFLHCKKHLSSMAVAGHSLGEFSALAAAEVLGVEEVIELAALRGRLMADAGGPDEGMTAVLKLPQSQVELIVESARAATSQEIRVANFNTPAQFVVSGKKDALDQVADLVKKEKGRAIPLPVSGAFHSPLMKEANKELAKVMETKDWRIPKCALFFNVTAKPEWDPAKIKDIMSRQMISPVRWIALMENVWGEGVRTFYEFGPKGVLSRMLGQILKQQDEDYKSEAVNGLEAAQNAFGS